jgi:hypothetical protein
MMVHRLGLVALAGGMLVLAGCGSKNANTGNTGSTTAASVQPAVAPGGSGNATPPRSTGTLTPGSTVQSAQWSMTLVTITDPYTPAAATARKPSAQNRDVLMHLTVKNIGTQQATFSPQGFTLTVAGTNILIPILGLSSTPLKMMTLPAGQATSGDLVFTVPLDAPLSALLYNAGATADNVGWQAS